MKGRSSSETAMSRIWRRKTGTSPCVPELRVGEAAVRVPEDIAVTGFDDIGFAAISAPPLTTLRQPAEAIGAQGVRILHERIIGNTGNCERRSLKPQLVVRRNSQARVPPTR